jgi:hypothetical protein
MPRYKSIVMSNAKDGKDEAFTRYLDEQHIPDVLAVPGFVSAQRYKFVAGTGEFQYMTIYELETDDLPAVLSEIQRRIAEGEIPLTDTSIPGTLASFFEPVAKGG